MGSLIIGLGIMLGVALILGSLIISVKYIRKNETLFLVTTCFISFMLAFAIIVAGYNYKETYKIHHVRTYFSVSDATAQIQVSFVENNEFYVVILNKEEWKELCTEDTIKLSFADKNNLLWGKEVLVT